MKRILITLMLIIVAFWLGMQAQSRIQLFNSFTALTPDGRTEQAAIKQTLRAQSAAWSAGDIDRFMQDYWRSDNLRFASAGTVKRGWQTTRDGYYARYPDRGAMGELTFTDLEINVLSSGHALVFGRWTLSRVNDAPTGLFTLHMRKEGERWIIVSDHTSSEV